MKTITNIIVGGILAAILAPIVIPGMIAKDIIEKKSDTKN